jgi:hypothetical protein
MQVSLLLVHAVTAATAFEALGWNELGAHAGFPVERARPGGVAYTYMSVADESALNLDGSRYGIAVCLSTVSKANWTFSADGGGWCYDEADCYGRSFTTLGSNKTWPGEAAQMNCNTAGTMNSARLFYGDGASRSGDVANPVSVPGNASQTMWFRGQKSFDSALDLLLTLGMSQAELIVFTGGSAGGLTVFLHLDHVAARLKTEAPNARVVGEPVCGYFLDAGNDGSQPWNVTYSLRMQYVFNMQQAAGSLSPACLSTYGIDAWKCIMAPHAVHFVSTPWFALQSRTDTWQLANIAMIPCTGNISKCPPQQWAQVQAYSPQFMDQFLANIHPDSHNGAFLDACLIHGSTSTPIDGLTNAQAFQSWLAGNATYGCVICSPTPAPFGVHSVPPPLPIPPSHTPNSPSPCSSSTCSAIGGYKNATDPSSLGPATPGRAARHSRTDTRKTALRRKDECSRATIKTKTS